ncbi:glycosyltransferase [Bacteroidales bacterium SW299]|nr:glycosyltransferase [Bacteroidales bacterium SW299]
MRKKVLFCIFDLKGGGAEKVLVNLLKQINPTKYDITVFALFGVGVNVKELPEYVKFKCIFRRQFRGLTTLMKIFSPGILHRLFIKEKYDIEVAYLETSPTRIISGAPKGTKKVCWVHTEEENRYAFISAYRTYREMISCYRQYNHIVFVSKRAKDVFQSNHPEISIHKSIIHNVNDYNDIIKKSQNPVTEELSSGIRICTVGRLIKLKGYLRLLEIIHKLNVEGLKNKFDLYILGTGGEYELLKSYINKYALDNVHLLGFQVNPYKYLSKMDLFVCSSYKEGYSTAATEAIILDLPVVTTDVSGMDEILHDGEFGLIVPNDSNALYKGLKDLISHPYRIGEYKKQIQTQSKKMQGENVKLYEQLFDAL